MCAFLKKLFNADSAWFMEVQRYSERPRVDCNSCGDFSYHIRMIGKFIFILLFFRSMRLRVWYVVLILTCRHSLVHVDLTIPCIWINCLIRRVDTSLFTSILEILRLRSHWMASQYSSPHESLFVRFHAQVHCEILPPFLCSSGLFFSQCTYVFEPPKRCYIYKNFVCSQTMRGNVLGYSTGLWSRHSSSVQPIERHITRPISHVLWWWRCIFFPRTLFRNFLLYVCFYLDNDLWTIRVIFRKQDIHQLRH